MDLISANTQIAPRRDTDDSGPSIERYVGEMIAAAAVAVAEALREFERGKLSSRTRTAGGDMIFEIYKLRAFMIGTWDFDRIALEYGRKALHEQCGSDADARTIEILIDGVMSILRTVVRAAVN